MNCFSLICVILVMVQLASLNNFVSSQPSLAELKLAQDVIFDDISAIKRKVWIQLASRVNSLETKITEIERINMCGVLNRTDHQGNTAPEVHKEDNTSPEVHTDIGHDREIYSVLLKGFKDEKSKSRRLEETLQQSLNVISVLENKLKNHDSVINSLSDRLLQLERHLLVVKTESETNRDTMITLQKSHSDLLQDTILLNESFHAKSNDTLNTIGKPSFVSEWILMRAQDPELAKQTVLHGLGTLPYKVDVQIRPTSGPNAGWIFPGDSAFQGDDDIQGEVYGGAVYFYDETNVYITVPIKSNDYDLGVIINTGGTKNRRLGNNQQTALEAYVRVKVWAPSDLPEPDMKSEWLPLDITNQSLTFYELPHGFSEYPGLVTVQIRCISSDGNIRISEGLGATLLPTKYSNAGGVVYAYNESSVRIWTGYLSNTVGNYYYRLFGLVDGWGTPIVRNIKGLKGHVRVLAWNRKTVNGRNNELEKHEENKEFAELSAFKQFSPDVDLFSFYVQANDGLNQGFRFPGYGNSQSNNSPFGGAVYAYNANGDVRIWRANPAVNGYLIHVHAPYGNGVNTQTSNNAHYVCSLLRSK